MSCTIKTWAPSLLSSSCSRTCISWSTGESQSDSANGSSPSEDTDDWENRAVDLVAYVDIDESDSFAEWDLRAESGKDGGFRVKADWNAEGEGDLVS